MKKLLLFPSFFFVSLTLAGCSIFGKSNVEIAPYKVIEKKGPYELRHYEKLILVSTAMSGFEEQKSPFRKLFAYISGNNKATQEISMTAPVFMDQGENKTETMSFVLPKDFSIKDAPIPKDPTVKLEEISNYNVATITFSGRLTQQNIQKNKALLESWITSQNYKIIGPAKAAGYNPPFTIPALRRNEILLPVKPQSP